MEYNRWYCKYNNVKIYINGSIEQGYHLVNAVPVNNEDFIGIRAKYKFRIIFEGKLDQVRIFQKALSSSEVSTLYAETVETVESLDPLSEDTTDTLQVLGDSSCIATYRFENDEADLSGNYDGTGTAIQYAAGRYGQAASFNGSTSRVLNSSFTAITGNAARTYNVWAYTNGSTSGALVCTGQWGVGGRSIALYIDQSINRFKAYGYTSSYDTDLGTLPTLSNGWHMFSLSWDGSSIYKAYIDGVLISTTTKNATFNTTSYLCIGDWYDATVGVYHYDNKIDQVRIFNKALSAAEVTTLYNENSLVASYRFEGNANDDMRAYDGSATNVTYEYGLGFTPDFVWIKSEDVLQTS